jgi:hypothetical protein
MTDPESTEAASEPCQPADSAPQPNGEEADHREEHVPTGLSFGVYVGTLVGLTLFAGMYMLSDHELRISATIFTAGLTLGVVGAMVALLLPGGRPGTGADASDTEEMHSPSSGLVLDGVAFGLGILLGTLPISLACSLFHSTESFPRVVYVLGGAMLMAVGVVRAPSLRALPSAVGQALLPGAIGVLAAHIIADLLCKRIFFQ